jgi:rubrerythrin
LKIFAIKKHFCRLNHCRKIRWWILVSVDGVKAGADEQICISMMIAEDSEEFSWKLNEARGESRKDKNKNEIYWVMMLNSDIYELLQNLYASRQMVFKYDQLRAQNKITQIELDCLNNEKSEESRIKSRLREKFSLSIISGSGLFRGTSKDGSTLGKTIYEIFKKFLDIVIPELYPKLEMAARSLKGTEAEEILKAANLNGLSAVFYSGEAGLNLVIKEGDKFVPNPSSEIASEILSYIKYEHSYGNPVTGKVLEEHFQGTGYGWDRDILRLVLAVLLRAGAIEITYQGRRYTSHHDPMCRTPLTNNAAFKSTSFAPRTTISFKILKEAVENYEDFTGDTVDAEESAIAQSFKKLAEEEIKHLNSLEAVIDANNLPVKDIIEDYKETVKNIINSSSDDCVIMLAGEGKSFEESRNCIKKIRKNLDSKGLKVIKDGRAVLEHICPVLENRIEEGNLSAEDLRNTINSKDFYEHTGDIKKLIVKIFAEYKKIYSDLHSRRSVIFDKAIEEIRSHSDWIKLSDEMQSIILKPLSSRICNEINLLDMNLTCSNCKASIAQMEADMAKIKHFTSEAIFKIQKERAPKKVIKRIRVSEFFPSSLETEEAIDEAVDKLREHLRNLVLEGVSIIFE